MTRREGVPAGRFFELPGCGTTFAVDLPAGDADAPVLALLHGWMSTGALNWGGCLSRLRRRFRVVAVDHRGHGHGIRCEDGFRLEDCADDVVALADALGVDRMIPVGYSMGGPVAQLAWRRHPDRVEGLVLCATSATFAGTHLERLMYDAMVPFGGAFLLLPRPVRRELLRMARGSVRDSAMKEWVFDESGGHDLTTIFEAARAVGRFSSRPWIHTLDVPAALVVTERDHIVPPARQIELARSIPGATIHTVDADHGAYFSRPDLFVPAVLDACGSVARRARGVRVGATAARALGEVMGRRTAPARRAPLGTGRPRAPGEHAVDLGTRRAARARHGAHDGGDVDA